MSEEIYRTSGRRRGEPQSWPPRPLQGGVSNPVEKERTQDDTIQKAVSAVAWAVGLALLIALALR